MSYLIITVCDRALESVDTADTFGRAVETANKRLEEHCIAIGHEDDYEAARTSGAKGVQLARDREGDRERNAWCNLGDYNWDAYITEAPAPGESTLMVASSD